MAICQLRAPVLWVFQWMSYTYYKVTWAHVSQPPMHCRHHHPIEPAKHDGAANPELSKDDLKVLANEQKHAQNKAGHVNPPVNPTKEGPAQSSADKITQRKQ